MAVTVKLKMQHEFTVKAKAKDVFDLLADVPSSAKHFPNVDKLTELRKNAYRWELGKAGTEKFNLQTVYACTYAADRKKGSISWSPIGHGSTILLSIPLIPGNGGPVDTNMASIINRRGVSRQTGQCRWRTPSRSRSTMSSKNSGNEVRFNLAPIRIKIANCTR